MVAVKKEKRKLYTIHMQLSQILFVAAFALALYIFCVFCIQEAVIRNPLSSCTSFTALIPPLEEQVRYMFLQEKR